MEIRVQKNVPVSEASPSVLTDANSAPHFWGRVLSTLVFQALPMNFRTIMAVENAFLRDALLNAIALLHCAPEVLMPDALLQTELHEKVLIFLETSDDVERLIDTASQLYTRSTETGVADLQFLSYSTRAVTPDSVVFRLWSIGPEMTVIVQAWEPENITPYLQGAHSLTRRLLEHWND